MKFAIVALALGLAAVGASAQNLKDVKVDFTMGFKRAPSDGHLELFLQHSSLPYEPKH